MVSVCELRMFVLAQLVAPPIQSGPVRLPENKAFERQEESDSILIEIPKASPTEERPVTKNRTPPVSMEPWIPVVQGKTPYTESELKAILRPCSGDRSPDTLRACAASLTAKLTADGFVNSRVFTLASPAPGQLKVVEGRLVEIRVTSDDVNLQERVSQQLKPLCCYTKNSTQITIRNLVPPSAQFLTPGHSQRNGPSQGLLAIAVGNWSKHPESAMNCRSDNFRD